MLDDMTIPFNYKPKCWSAESFESALNLEVMRLVHASTGELPDDGDPVCVRYWVMAALCVLTDSCSDRLANLPDWGTP